MSWFEEQIKQRQLNDDELFADSFALIADAITGKKNARQDQFEITRDAINTILKYYGFNAKQEVPKEITDFNQQLEYLTRPYGVMVRRIQLTDGWYKDCVGAVLGFRSDDGRAVALLPNLSNGYSFDNNGRMEKMNRRNSVLIDRDGYCFYKPFPNRKLSPVDLVKYAIETRSGNDFVTMALFMLITSLIGLLVPKITYFLYGTVVDGKSISLLLSTIVFLVCLNVSTILFNLYKTLYNSIISTKMQISVQAATMMRILSLPADFFRRFSSGELANRAGYVQSLANSLTSLIFDTGFTSLFSLVYILSIFKYAPSLVVSALAVILITVTFSVVSSLVQSKITQANMENSSKLSGLSYTMVSGIRKIRLSGSEKRAFAKWAKLYSNGVKNTYNPPALIKMNKVIALAISLTGTLVMYYVAAENQISLAQYNAFNAAYGMVFSAFSSLVSIALSVSNIKPIIEMAGPILETEPEVAENKKVITSIKGQIELSHVSFKYDDSSPLIIDDLSLKIKPGQYIAIVGKTGCGKSTLIRLLLGFEKAQKGSIYYDNKDIGSVDLKSLRRKIGVVMQDGKLFAGDIYSNITINAPWLTLDEAWKAADMASIGDDIRDMPMGMHTLISEGGGGISGGQRQRLLIARAIAPKPKILIFDEATSALDNITQKVVSDSLDNLKCTRIVIAHRLSTIKHCDRILYLENGKIAEDGTYDELIEQNGLFAQLVQRQRLDVEQ